MSVAVLKPSVGSEVRSFLGKPHHLLIDNKWVAAKSGKTFAVEDPATQEVIAKVAEGDAADIDLAVAAARRAFDSGPWARMLPAQRAKLVWRLGDLLEQHADEFAQLESLDNGKPVTAARAGDVAGSIEMFRYMSGWATRLVGETIPVSSPGNWLAYTVREPVGVVGQIIPWNFPLMMAAWKLAPALAAGCTIVLKPAALGPALRRADRRGGLPGRRGQHRHGLRRDRGCQARRPSQRRQGGVHRLDRGRQADRPGVRRQPQAGEPRARRQVAADRLPRREARQRDRGHGQRHLLQHGPVLHGGLAPVRPQEGVRQDRRRPDQRGRQAQDRPWPRPDHHARAAGLRRAAQEGVGLSGLGPQRGRRGGDRRRPQRQPWLLRAADRARQDQPGHEGRARGDLRAGGVRPAVRGGRPRRHREVRERHRIRPVG